MTNISRQFKHQHFSITKPTIKQLLKHNLFLTVQQIHGDQSFKTIFKNIITIHFQKRLTIPKQYFQRNFGYVVSGQVFIYKKRSKRLIKAYESMRQECHHEEFEKIFVTSHKIFEVYGLHEHTLNWGDELYAEASQNSKIFVFPLQLSLSCFKKIFNMSAIQSKTQLLKKTTIFKDIQIQKLRKLALNSTKYKGKKNQLIIKQGTTFDNIFLLLSGQCSYIQPQKMKRIYKQGDLIGIQQIDHEGNPPQTTFTLSCLSQCQFLSIYKPQAEKLCNIKYRLDDKQSLFVFSRRQTQFQQQQSNNMKQQEIERSSTLKFHQNIKQNNKNKFIFFKTEPREQSLIKARPYTSGSYKINRSSTDTNFQEKKKDVKYLTFYSSTKKENIKLKTEHSASQCTMVNNTKEKQSHADSMSLGKLCLRKFMSRKEKIENVQIIRYLKSNAPELKLNPHKQYALIKPLHVVDSNYIKNLKRKLKRNFYKYNNETKRQQNETNIKLYSFLMKQDIGT